MSDARYTAEATFKDGVLTSRVQLRSCVRTRLNLGCKDDSSRCARNFLHRYRLKFEVADMAQRYQEVGLCWFLDSESTHRCQVEEQLPQDLANVLDLLEPVSVASAQGIRSSRP